MRHALLVPFPEVVDAFEVAFPEPRRFPQVLYLAPEPAHRFAALTDALAARLPEWPPYGGAFAELRPHLTVAQALLDEAEAEISQRLPLQARAREAVLLAELEPERWQRRARFAFREA